ncbi:MAG TPA: enoyl-CoA hydratase-related protein [Dehalococcoidia bacterium]|nr:enoyl-CoA hydratase-related protein [Dehalococcoidia bacterium]
MEYTAIGFEQDGGVATITLNRPEAFNSLNMAMAQELFDAAHRCDADPAIRAVLITGAGRAFCGGGDLKSFAAQADTPRHLKEVTTYLHGAISRLARSDKPTIAAVNGAAAGAGFSLMLACDLALAARSAKLTMAYTKAGLSPDGSSSFYLPRIVGMRRALELTLTNRVLSAEEAEDWGIVCRAVPDAELLPESRALAAQLAEGATLAFGKAKALLRGSFSESLETQMENETQAISELARTADYREGSAAFFEKRAPRFSGR